MNNHFIFRCDGSLITAPSPWEGEKTPNINGEERFLRGGLDGVQLHTEEDSLQAHSHLIIDPGHSHSYDDKYWQRSNSGYSLSLDNIIFSTPSHASTSATSKTNIKVTDVKDAQTSDETRPKNIRVVYIMKVF